jgi:hypothetical protein
MPRCTAAILTFRWSDTGTRCPNITRGSSGLAPAGRRPFESDSVFSCGVIASTSARSRGRPARSDSAAGR